MLPIVPPGAQFGSLPGAFRSATAPATTAAPAARETAPAARTRTAAAKMDCSTKPPLLPMAMPTLELSKPPHAMAAQGRWLNRSAHGTVLTGFQHNHTTARCCWKPVATQPSGILDRPVSIPPANRTLVRLMGGAAAFVFANSRHPQPRPHPDSEELSGAYAPPPRSGDVSRLRERKPNSPQTQTSPSRQRRAVRR